MPTDRFQIASGSRSTTWFGRVLAGLLLATSLGIALLALPRGPVAFAVSADGLRVSGDPYGRTFSRPDC